MKLNSIVSVLLGLSISMSPALAAKNQKNHPIVAVKKAMLGSYHSGSMPEGYSDKRLYRNRPKFNESFLNYLAKLEKKKQKLWEKFVKTDEEYSDLTDDERAEKAKDAKTELGVRYLVEIEAVYKVFKDGEHIGYVYETADHVQAAIYQDGAGIVIYTDVDLNVITTDDWSA